MDMETATDARKIATLRIMRLLNSPSHQAAQLWRADVASGFPKRLQAPSATRLKWRLLYAMELISAVSRPPGNSAMRGKMWRVGIQLLTAIEMSITPSR